MKTIVSLTVNGEARDAMVDTRDTLLGLLRGSLGLTGTKEGCSNGNCGACTVLVNGDPVCACIMFAVEAGGQRITTVEGVADGNLLHAVQSALIEAGGTQCGFCTPGIVMSAVALLARNPQPNEHEIRHAIAGNICRCTGYGKIVEAVQMAALANQETSA
jgi:aerobic carbon-monoxide dehydrogenase small subunit